MRRADLACEGERVAFSSWRSGPPPAFALSSPRWIAAGLGPCSWPIGIAAVERSCGHGAAIRARELLLPLLSYARNSRHRGGVGARSRRILRYRASSRSTPVFATCPGPLSMWLRITAASRSLRRLPSSFSPGSRSLLLVSRGVDQGFSHRSCYIHVPVAPRPTRASVGLEGSALLWPRETRYDLEAIRPVHMGSSSDPHARNRSIWPGSLGRWLGWGNAISFSSRPLPLLLAYFMSLLDGARAAA